MVSPRTPTPHTHQEQPVTAMPIHLLAADGGPEHKPGAVQKVARLHEKAVQKVAHTDIKPKRTRKAPGPKRHVGPSGVTRRALHPALKMAYDLGIESERVEVTAEPPLWGAIIHNDGSWRDAGR